jgi:hypothetical protein
MFAIPSIAIDYYADFFSINPRTYFWKINIVRLMEGCPYSDQLGVVFASRYGVGNLNASLFATEGIASVGLIWSPIVMFLCGVVLSVGNSCSRQLPAPMMATSSALAFQALLNVKYSAADKWGVAAFSALVHLSRRRGERGPISKELARRAGLGSAPKRPSLLMSARPVAGNLLVSSGWQAAALLL